MAGGRGKVYIIGSGPGDPELITVKGLKALKAADCVLYDFLSSPGLLDELGASSEKICVGKADGLHLKEQDEINRLLCEKAGHYKKVARLKGGDPFVFSRGFEEKEFLEERGIEVEVIPGITSALSGPESFGIPLTLKDKVTSVALVAGRRKDPGADIEAPTCGTVVYLMPVGNIANIVRALLGGGRDPGTPCAFIERVTRGDARIIRGTLNTIQETALKEGVSPPAVFIVGDVVDHG